MSILIASIGNIEKYRL